MNIHEFLARLEHVKKTRTGWTARCPGHDDHHNSLSVSEGTDGEILLHCHAGCETLAILKALDLNWSVLWGEQALKAIEKMPSPKIITYDYTDENGNLLFQVVRTPDKQFPQRRPNGKGGWIWGLQEVTSVLYRLPALLQAKARGETLFIVEGEKDADRLVSLGLTATTNPMGAGKWKDRYSESFTGANVVILPDNDEPGEKHARSVALSLQGIALTIKVVHLPGLPPKGDISDWLDQGGTLEGLQRLIDQTPLFTPSDRLDQEVTACEEVLTVAAEEEYEDLKPGSWADLDELNHTQWCWKGWLAQGFLTLVAGLAGCCKSALALRICQTVIQGLPWPDNTRYEGEPGKVCWCEGESGQGINKKRLHEWGIPKEAVLTPIPALCDLSFDLPAHRQAIERQAALPEVRLIVVDSLSGIYGGEENESKIRKVTKWFAKLAQTLQKPVLLVHHVRKTDTAETNMTQADIRGHGSIAQNCRTIWGIDAPNPADLTQKRLKQVKNNLAILADPVGFGWQDDRLVFGEAPSPPRQDSIQEKAKERLLTLLRNKPLPSREVEELLREEGFSERTIKQARQALSLTVSKTGAGQWMLSLAKQEPEDD